MSPLRDNVHRCFDSDCPDSSQCERFLQRRTGNDAFRRTTLRDRRTGECDMFLSEDSIGEIE